MDYQTFVALDDVSVNVLEKSLIGRQKRDVLLRIQQDYMSDFGAVGLLRARYFETKSLVDVSRMFWLSRREPLSPRLESLLSQILLNLVSSVLYDVLKELAISNAEQVSTFLDARGLSVAVLPAVSETASIWAHARTMLELYRLKATGRESELREVVEQVIGGGSFHEATSADREFEQLRLNITSVARGLILVELEKLGEAVLVSNSLKDFIGLPVSAGFGWGRPVRWSGTEINIEAKSVLVVPSIGGAMPEDLINAMRQSSGILCSDNMTGHVAITCRSNHLAGVSLGIAVISDIMRFPFVVLDGTNGKVRGYGERPAEFCSCP